MAARSDPGNELQIIGFCACDSIFTLLCRRFCGMLTKTDATAPESSELSASGSARLSAQFAVFCHQS
jgi:hypothetical protein